MKKIRFFIATILLLAMTVTRRVTVVLDFPRDIDEFITYAKAIYLSMSGNAMFSPLAAKLAALNNAISDLVLAQTGIKATLPTHTIAQREAALLIVQNCLRGLRLDVQVMVDADAEHAETIVAAANMKVKQFGTINKQDFVVKRGPITETAKLIAKGLRVRNSNDWQMSQDGTNWTALDSTLAANTLAIGLNKTQTLDFRHRYILKDGPTDWVYFTDYIVT